MGFVSKMVKLFEKRLDFEEIPNLLNYINMIQKRMSEGLYLAHYPFTFDLVANSSLPFRPQFILLSGKCFLSLQPSNPVWAI